MTTRARWARRALAGALAVGALVWSLSGTGLLDPRVYARGLRNLGEFSRDFLPPDLDREVLRTLIASVGETIEMAYAGTAIGIVLALPLAVLAARSLSGAVVSGAVRGFLAVVRTIPALLWALVFVIMVGLGARAGVLALAAYTVGYFGKLYSEALEAVDPDVLEAARATGASKWQVVRHAVIPETGNALVSQVLFLFEYNVRASAVLGLVGAGGIGFYVLAYLQFFEYAKLATALLLLLIVVVASEAVGRAARKRYVTTARSNA